MSHANRIRSLDGLRGVAAIAVMLFHFNVFFLPQARLSGILPLLNRGYLAVDLFFLLSGFVMTHVYGRSLASNWRAHWAPFALARFARIYPAFALTTLAMLALVAIAKMPLASISFSGRSLALQPFLLQQWHSGLSWNYPSWSISTEAEAYVFFVFSAGLLVTGRCPLLVAACCAAVLATMCIANGGSLNFFEGFPALFRALSDFSLGALLYRAHSGDARFLRKWAAVLECYSRALGSQRAWISSSWPRSRALFPMSSMRPMFSAGSSTPASRSLSATGRIPFIFCTRQLITPSWRRSPRAVIPSGASTSRTRGC